MFLLTCSGVACQGELYTSTANVVHGNSSTSGTGDAVDPGSANGKDETAAVGAQFVVQPSDSNLDADSDSAGPDADAPPSADAGSSEVAVSVKLIPQGGVSGQQRVNFAVPFARGTLDDATRLHATVDGVELPIATRALARHNDGSIRSVQVQLDLDCSGEKQVEVRIAEPQAAQLELATVESTLLEPNGTTGPRVWAVLPAAWLSASGVAGHQVPEADVAGTELDAWSRLCSYDEFGVDSFLSQMGTSSVWLYDRGTVFYRGHARRGDLGTLATAYRETAIYRSGLTGSGTTTRIGIADKVADLKYHYTQNLALHYLLTGDDRFREAAENVAERVSSMWQSPGYAGGSDFWTERHAGFALLAYVWAGIVSDDRAASFSALADSAVNAYVDVQNAAPSATADGGARCFAHQADAHDEPFGYAGCSPWMSAILADGLEAYATEAGAEGATRAADSIVKLGRMLANRGRDAEGRPYYWMGAGSEQNEPDEYEEHWGESAYVVGMAWHYSGRTDAGLRQAADELVTGLATRGTAPHMRSANWQCRSAVGASFFLK
jgi:hypothetical protein